MDPATTIPSYVEQLNAADLQDIKADIEAQYAEWKTTQTAE